MRSEPNLLIEQYRRSHPLLGSSPAGANYGFFVIERISGDLRVISSGSDGEFGWEHVSVSLEDRLPTWDELRLVKDLFWDDEETVIQFIPKKSRYVNYCKTCLHLWKKVGVDHELPPEEFI